MLARHICPVCGQTELQDKAAHGATEILVYPKHYRSARSRTILKDAEKDPAEVDLPLES